MSPLATVHAELQKLLVENYDTKYEIVYNSIKFYTCIKPKSTVILSHLAYTYVMYCKNMRLLLNTYDYGVLYQKI